MNSRSWIKQRQSLMHCCATYQTILLTSGSSCQSRILCNSIIMLLSEVILSKNYSSRNESKGPLVHLWELTQLFFAGIASDTNGTNSGFSLIESGSFVQISPWDQTIGEEIDKIGVLPHAGFQRCQRLSLAKCSKSSDPLIQFHRSVMSSHYAVAGWHDRGIFIEEVDAEFLLRR